MIFLIRLLGLYLLHVELVTDPPEDDDCDLSGGTTAATPMGFVPRMDAPHEIETPDRDW